MIINFEKERNKLFSKLSKDEIDFYSTSMMYTSSKTYFIDIDKMFDNCKTVKEIKNVDSSIKSMFKKSFIYIGENSEGKQYYMNPVLFSDRCNVSATIKTFFNCYRFKTLNNTRWGDIKE